MWPQIPPLAPYPETSWRTHLSPEEWEACLESWITLGGAHLALSEPEFQKFSVKDDSLSAFLTSFMAQAADSNGLSLADESSKSRMLRKTCFLLSHRLLESNGPPRAALLSWEFLANTCKVFGRKNARKLNSLAQKNYPLVKEASMMSLKNSLSKELDAGINGDLVKAQSQLKKLSHILHASPEVASFFMAGSDFLDALTNGFKVMNPPLRKLIILNTYLCLIGLIESEIPNLSLLGDQLYSLRAAAEAHRKGSTNTKDSLVVELVTVTTILQKLQQRLRIKEAGSSRANSIILSLKTFVQPVRAGKYPKRSKKELEKGKSKVSDLDDYRCDLDAEAHRACLISEVQELFPDLGSGFISRLLLKYGENVETVISHILEGSFSPDLEELDKSEPMKQLQEVPTTNLTPKNALPLLPTRRNVFDNDEFDRLAVDSSRIHFGRQDTAQEAESFLNNRSTFLNKSAIYSSLAAFDLDDDERDDTYDVADVGGTVDLTLPGEDIETQTASQTQSVQDEALFRAYKSNPEVFARDAAVRRGEMRKKLKQQLRLTDEVIEGWALMLKRDPSMLRRLEANFDEPINIKRVVATPAWKATESQEKHGDGVRNDFTTKNFVSQAHSDTEKPSKKINDARSTIDPNIGTTRRDTEAKKASRGNHNRKKQRAKKVARGGF